MARTPSKMIPLGTEAPDFTLPDTVSGNEYSLQDLKGAKGTVIMFICNHCPFVKHVNNTIINIARKFEDQGISFIAISSNDVENYPEDHPKKMKEVAEVLSYPFPYLFDKSQKVAKLYEAACTPDFYLFDENLELFYRGRLDASTPGNGIPTSGKDLRGAIKSLINNDPSPEDQEPSIGCNIKWKS